MERTSKAAAAALAMLVCVPTLGTAGAADLDAYAAEGRGIAKRFMQNLGGALKAALEEQGPQGAITVCRMEEPEIRSALAADTGWQVGRTAIRFRDAANAPTGDELAIMQAFERRLAAGEDPAAVEAVRVVERDGAPWVHYMKAIPTGPLCTTCHGTDVDPDLLAEIRRQYPDDRAVGFEVGDLRGAFTFYAPLAEAD